MFIYRPEVCQKIVTVTSVLNTGETGDIYWAFLGRLRIYRPEDLKPGCCSIHNF